MLRFTIRDLIWLTVVAALGVGRWMDHRKASKLEEAERRITHYMRIIERLQAKNYSLERKTADMDGLDDRLEKLLRVGRQSAPKTASNPSAPAPIPSRD